MTANDGDSIPRSIGGAKLIMWAAISDDMAAGECGIRPPNGSLPIPRFVAIAADAGGPFVYLFRCSGDWSVTSDTWHESLEDALRQAEHEYRGVGERWVELGDVGGRVRLDE